MLAAKIAVVASNDCQSGSPARTGVQSSLDSQASSLPVSRHGRGPGGPRGRRQWPGGCGGRGPGLAGGWRPYSPADGQARAGTRWRTAAAAAVILVSSYAVPVTSRRGPEQCYDRDLGRASGCHWKADSTPWHGPITVTAGVSGTVTVTVTEIVTSKLALRLAPRHGDSTLFDIRGSVLA